MKRITRRIGLFALVTLLLAPAAWAQGQQQQQQRPPAPEVEVDDNELQTVADVYLEIETIQSEYRPKMQQAEGQEQLQQLRMEFQQEVNTKLQEEEEITPDRFNKIMRAAQADKELQGRLMSAIEEARGSESGDTTSGGNGSS